MLISCYCRKSNFSHSDSAYEPTLRLCLTILSSNKATMRLRATEPGGADPHGLGKLIGGEQGENKKQVVGQRGQVRYFGAVSVVTKTLWGKWNYCTHEREPQLTDTVCLYQLFPALNTCYFCCTDMLCPVTLGWHLITTEPDSWELPALTKQVRLVALPAAMQLPRQGLERCFQLPWSLICGHLSLQLSGAFVREECL